MTLVMVWSQTIVLFAYQEVEMVLKSENADVLVVKLAFVMSQRKRIPSCNNSPCLHAISSHKV